MIPGAIYKEIERLTVAIELKVWILLCNFNPSDQIGKVKEVSRLMNSDQFSRFCAVNLNAVVYKIGGRINPAILQRLHNSFKVLSTGGKGRRILRFRTGGKAPKGGLRTVLDLCATVGTLNGERLAKRSAWAGLASGQVEDQGLLAQFGVTLGELKHGSEPLD